MANKTKTTAKPRGKGVPFPPGNNANPVGAPVKEMRVSTWIMKELEKTPEGYEALVTNAQIIARNLVEKAKSKDQEALAYMKEVMDRTEGKPKQSTDITNSDGSMQPILVKFIGDQDLSTAEDK